MLHARAGGCPRSGRRSGGPADGGLLGEPFWVGTALGLLVPDLTPRAVGSRTWRSWCGTGSCARQGAQEEVATVGQGVAASQAPMLHDALRPVADRLRVVPRFAVLCNVLPHDGARHSPRDTEELFWRG